MKRYAAALFSPIILAGVAVADNAPLNLTLKDALRYAVERNLDLKAEFYNPAQAESDTRRNRAIYETHLKLDTSYRDSSNFSTTSNSELQQKSFVVTPGAYRLLPSGGTAALNFQNALQDNSGVVSAGRYWSSSLELSLSQPLMKNFGREATELNIRVAESAKEGALNHLKTRVIATVAQVATEYYRLGSLQEDLASRQVSLQLAQKILADTEARVKAGVMPAMEILNALYGVSSREKELIDAVRGGSDQMDLIRTLLQLEGGGSITAVDKPERTTYALNEDDAVRRALASRPELDELASQLKAYEIQERVAMNRTRPDLNLLASAAVTGSGSRLGRDMERTGSMDYPVWSIGLQFDQPLGNQTAENDYIKSRLRTEQLKVQIASLQASIANEVRGAVRGVNSSYKQLDVTDRARAYAEERLRAYMKKLEVGLATNKDLLDVENDLAAARSGQIKARAAYAISLQQLWKSTGEILERDGIVVSYERSDEIYRWAK